MPHDDPRPDDLPPGDEPVTSGGPSAPVSADGAPAPRPRRRRMPVRALAVWLLGLFISLALAVIAAWSGVLLAVFGLSAIALAVSVLVLAIVATVWRRAALPGAVIVCALTLATAAQALDSVRYKPQIGTEIVTPASPSAVPAAGYHHGVGPLLVDLRRFHAQDGSSTAISASNDVGELVVALPRGRCFNLVVDAHASVTPQGGIADQALRLAGVDTFNHATTWGDTGLSTAADQERNERDDIAVRIGGQSWTPLFAYGRGPQKMGGAHYERPAAGIAGAPTIHLNLRATQQIVIRDYPNSVGPLDGGVEYDQQDGLLWPSAVAAPPSPGQLRFADAAWVRTPSNRARWVAWDRTMLVWAKAQAARYAGSCASRDELRERAYSFLTQPAQVRDSDGHVSTLLGSAKDRVSPIPQSPVAAGKLLSVEVNGLGEVHTAPINGIVAESGDNADGGGSSDGAYGGGSSSSSSGVVSSQQNSMITGGTS